MSDVLRIGDYTHFVGSDGDLIKAQLRALVQVGVFAIGKPGHVQYNVTAQGVEQMSKELQVKILRAAADYLEGQ